MDENRLQAYQQLIQDLLDCPSGEESQILQVNSEWVDAGLVLMMQQAAQQMATEGESNANWLSNYALEIAYNLGIIAATPQEYEQFLMQILEAIIESDGNPQVVYLLLEDNVDKLDDGLTHILQIWATQTLSSAEADLGEGEFIAAILNNFGNLIQQFPLGDKASNMETAIASYQNALQVYTRNSFPQQWATTQNNLGEAYRDRIKGDRADNLENAIASYQNALQVLTRNSFPQQ
ncbi:MAG: tetratricopeptide repeat protein [Microcoleaceae cyanobacterium]